MEKPDIVEILERECIGLRRRGRYLWSHCPLHSENTPSFLVNEETQRFKCFGCGEAGDVIAFVRKYKNLSYRDALKYLDISGNYFKQVVEKPQEILRRKLSKAIDKWCNFYVKEISGIVRLAHQINLALRRPEDIAVNGLVEMYLLKEMYESYFEVLNDGDIESKISLWRAIEENEIKKGY